MPVMTIRPPVAIGIVFATLLWLTTAWTPAAEAQEPAPAAMARATALLRPGMDLTQARQALSARLHRLQQATGSSLPERAEWLRKEEPEATAALLREADLILAGQLVLPGTKGKPFPVGDPPRWHDNPVADNEYVWLLNRMYHWPKLLQAWQLSGKRAYAEKVAGELDDWLAACPRPPLLDASGGVHAAYSGVQPWRILEAGIRMRQSWRVMIEFLIDDPLLTPERFARLVISLQEHGEALATVSPRLWPNADHNHFLTESVGLLAVAATLPELAAAEGWRDQAIGQLVRCAGNQFVTDGGQIEGCPNYHEVTVIDFCRALAFAKEAGAAFPPATIALLRHALVYSLHSTRPTGCTVPWGDSDASVEAPEGAVAAALWWRQVADDAEPLRILTDLAGPKAVRALASKMVWQLGIPGTPAGSPASPGAATLPLVDWQHGLSQVMMRTGWNREALSVFFACRTPIQNAHAHQDPGGFDFTALGRALVVDPGRFCYRDDADRRAFKSARWHSVLTVGDRDPFPYVSSWKYGPQREGRMLGVHQEEGLVAAVCLNRNYEPAVHRRALALVAGRCLVVLDAVDGLAATESVQRWFHLDSTQVAWQADSRQGVAVYEGGISLTLASASLAGTEVATTEPGRVSEVMDRSHPSTRLRLEDASGPARRCYAAVLVPARTTDPAPRIGDLLLTDTAGTLRCRFTLDGQAYALTWAGEDVTRE